MTHPDILKMERLGEIYPPKVHMLGRCAACGQAIYDDEICWEADTGELFCERDCIDRYYGIKEIG